MKEELLELRWALLGRLLYALLHPDESYPEFLHHLSKLPASIRACFDSLLKHFLVQRPTMIVLHLDETNVLDATTLESLDRIAAEMVFESNIFFVVIQTGVRTAMMQVL